MTTHSELNKSTEFFRHLDTLKISILFLTLEEQYFTRKY